MTEFKVTRIRTAIEYAYLEAKTHEDAEQAVSEIKPAEWRREDERVEHEVEEA